MFKAKPILLEALKNILPPPGHQARSPQKTSGRGIYLLHLPSAIGAITDSRTPYLPVSKRYWKTD
jgi:hypothetical protein